MSLPAQSEGRLDRLAMALSGLCLVHCLATAILLSAMATAAGFLGEPIIHEVGLVIAILLGVVALGRGIVRHGFLLPSAIGLAGFAAMAAGVIMPEGMREAAFTVIGVSLVALAHQLNRMAVQ